MISDMLAGPIVLDHHMTGHNYLRLSAKWITRITRDVPLATQITIYFHYDRVPSHYTQLVMQHLNDIIPNWWVGQSWQYQ
jgi:hypothetical protein